MSKTTGSSEKIFSRHKSFFLLCGRTHHISCAIFFVIYSNGSVGNGTFSTGTYLLFVYDCGVPSLLSIDAFAAFEWPREWLWLVQNRFRISSFAVMCSEVNLGRKEAAVPAWRLNCWLSNKRLCDLVEKILASVWNRIY